MAAAYAPDATFEDPAFGELTGREAGEMWKMLTAQADDLSIELADHEAADAKGSAHWIARYTFTTTGRPVVNDVRASFRFRDGLIVEHIDRFSFHRWSRQALGPVGLLLGWTPLLQAKVRKQARGNLDAYMSGGGSDSNTS